MAMQSVDSPKLAHPPHSLTSSKRTHYTRKEQRVNIASDAEGNERGRTVMSPKSPDGHERSSDSQRSTPKTTSSTAGERRARWLGPTLTWLGPNFAGMVVEKDV